MNSVSKIRILFALSLLVLVFGCLNSGTSSSTAHGQVKATKEKSSNQTTNISNGSIQNTSFSIEVVNTSEIHPNNYTIPQQFQENNSEESNKSNILGSAKKPTKLSIKEFVERYGPVECKRVNMTGRPEKYVEYLWVSPDEAYFKSFISYPILNCSFTFIGVVDAKEGKIYARTPGLMQTIAIIMGGKVLNQTRVNCVAAQCAWIVHGNKSDVNEFYDTRLFENKNFSLTYSNMVPVGQNISCKRVHLPFPLTPDNITQSCNWSEYEDAADICFSNSTS